MDTVHRGFDVDRDQLNFLNRESQMMKEHCLMETKLYEMRIQLNVSKTLFVQKFDQILNGNNYKGKKMIVDKNMAEVI